MKSSSARVAQILRDAFDLHKQKHETTLFGFCAQHSFDYKRVSRWMSKGLRYPHKETVDELNRLCGLLDVNPADLWDEERVEVSLQFLADTIRKLEELQESLRKLSPKLRRNDLKSR